MSLHSSTEKASFEIVYESISQSDMLTVKKVNKYSTVNEITAETEHLTECLHNTQLEVCRAFVKSQEY